MTKPRLFSRLRMRLDQFLAEYNAHCRFGQPDSTVQCAPLERRILMSASPVASLIADAPETLLAAPDQQQSELNAAATPLGSSQPSGESQQITQTSTATSHELVLIDTSAAEYQQLLDDIVANSDQSRQFDVFLFDPIRDGIEQITDLLSGYTNLDALHIVSHGREGQVSLGSSVLDSSSLAANARKLAGWNNSFADGGDILFYGCDLAANEPGREFVETLGDLTGTDVGASVDNTGHVKLGGNWDLEFAAGNVSADIAFSIDLQQNWFAILPDSDQIVTVTTTADEIDGDTSNITALQATPGGTGISLREAITAANNTDLGTVPDEIHFNIPGVGVQRIELSNVLGALPAIVDDVIIDGWTPLDFVSSPVIEIDGLSTAGSADGLHVTSGGTTIRGLSIINFGGSGIELNGSSGNTLHGNYLGVAADGTGAGNLNNGLHINNSSSNQIGGDGPNERNIASFNGGITGDGIRITGTGSFNNVVAGNYVGLDPTGTEARANSTNGIYIAEGATNTTLGGSTLGHGNVISGNFNDGVEISGSDVSGHRFENNFIGTAADGVTALENGANGIFIEDSPSIIVGTPGSGNVIAANGLSGVRIAGVNATGIVVQGNKIGTDLTETQTTIGNSGSGVFFTNRDDFFFPANIGSPTGNLIGGTAPGEANVISHNNGNGVNLAVGSQNSIRGNIIYSNAVAPGIDLQGITTNDAGDGDGGANLGQNYPVLTSATVTGSNLAVVGTLNTTNNTTLVIDFFASVTQDASGFGGAERYLDSITVLTDGSGNATISSVLSGVGVVVGEFFTATATDPLGNTSEFSLNIQAVDDGNEAPTIAAFADTSVLADHSLNSIPVVVSDIETPAASLIVTATSSNQTIIPDSNLVVSGTGANRTISVTPAAGQSGGPVTITVTVDDGIEPVQETFDVTVVPRIITVTTTDDEFNGNTSNITSLIANPGGSGISLREAIAATNNTTAGATPDEIHFNIAGAGPHTFTPGSALPSLTDAVVVDGTTQAGYAGLPLIVIDGNGANQDGLVLTDSADGSTIRGLAIRNFQFNGIFIQANSDNHIIEANWLGALDPTNGELLADEGNGNSGILVFGSGTTIGGTSIAQQNIASGNFSTGIAIDGAGASNNIVTGNLIGTNSSADTVIANAFHGLRLLNGASFNTIGGSATGAGNVISGNGLGGIGIFNSSSNNTILGNLIGTDSTLTHNLGTPGTGIQLFDTVSNNIIGGIGSDEGNTIANHGGSGIALGGTGTGNSIRGNVIEANGGIGIDLFFDDITLNDDDDIDSGANNLQNFPVLTEATAVAADLNVVGTLDSTPNTTYQIDFYASVASDGTGHGEAERYIDTITIVTDSSGDANFDQVLTGAGTSPGEFVTATATNSAGNTSEFSANTVVVPPNTAPVLTSVGGQTIAPSTNEDTISAAFVISDIVGTTITGVDTLPLKGIALTSVNGNGVWQYSLDGTAWLEVSPAADPVSTTSALLLRASDFLRYVPDNANGETASITYRAWDQTEGSEGTKTNPGTGGGTTEFSVASDTAILSVTHINDSPTGNASITGTLTEDEILTASNTLADVDGLGTITYQWRRAGIDIAGATDATYTLADADVGTQISVIASYTDARGTSESVSSPSVGPVASINDSPTGTVSIGGTPTEDQTLTASNTLADVDGLGTITYQWRRAGIDIAGATDATYTLADDDVGIQISVVASYTDARGTSESVSSPSVGPVANINDSPTGTVSIGGTPTEDQTLTASNTLADVDGLGTITYQWRRAGIDIAGATDATYTLADADVGIQISVVASYTDARGTSESVSSSSVGPVANINDSPTGAASIGGTPTEDQTLTASNTLADADGLGTINYQWQRAGVNIAGATATTYVLTDADVGTQISVVASYTDAQGTAESVSSIAVGPIANVNDLPTGVVSIAGTPAEDQTLTASNTLSDADGLSTISYQWQRDGSNITTATASTYTLTDTDVGTQISVVASYTDARATAESVSSAAIGPIANVNDLPTGVVSIAGTPAEDQTLTASNTIADADGLGAISYQWQRGGADITGATVSFYTLADADVGSQISVIASYTDAAGTAESVSSTSVGPIANVNDIPTGTVSITGISTEDQTLTASNTLADVDGLGTITYQWQRNGIDIPTATSSSYALVDADVGQQILVDATYTDSQGTAESVDSAAVGPISNVNDSPTGTVTIVGSPSVGTGLTLSNTIADTDGLGSFTYQWQRDGVDIAGETTSSYTVSTTDIAKFLSVEINYTDGQGTAELVTSAAVGPATLVNSSPTGNVTISGTLAEDSVLTAANTLVDTDGIPSISYQWRRDGIAIPGETTSTFLLNDLDVGSFISVSTNYVDGGGTNESIVSSAAGPISNVNDSPTGSVTIAGAAIENETLAASNSLSDDDGLGIVAYQWQRNGVDITGANLPTYTLEDADVGNIIRAIARYTDGRGISESVPSADVGPISNINDAPTGTLTIAGIPQENQVLTAASAHSLDSGCETAFPFPVLLDCNTHSRMLMSGHKFLSPSATLTAMAR